MYRSYSYSNMPQVKNTFKEKEKPATVQTPPQASAVNDIKCSENVPLTKSEHTLPFGLKTDDLILIAIICALLINRCNDKLLLLALAYIFFSDCYD